MSTDQLLRSLDVATSPTVVQQKRADALLERVLLEPLEPIAGGARRQTTTRRTRVGLGALLAAGLTVAAVAIVVPGLSPDSAAVASWTPTAVTVLTSDLAFAEDTCRNMMQDMWTPGSDAELLVSERRGDIVALSFHQKTPSTSTECVIDLPAGTTNVRDLWAGLSTAPTATPDPNSFLKGGEAQVTMGGQYLSVATGSVGTNVQSLTIRTADHEAVATISAGRYVAWLPGPIAPDLNDQTGDSQPSLLAYDLTLTDGTMIRNAESAFPVDDLCAVVPKACP